MCVCYKYTVLCVEIFSKIQRNGILQTKPSVIHFDGYEVGKIHQQTLVSMIRGYVQCHALLQYVQISFSSCAQVFKKHMQHCIWYVQYILLLEDF